MKETIEKAAKDFVLSHDFSLLTNTNHIANRSFQYGAEWQQEKILKFINDEDNHIEGELGNSCIDVQALIYFITQFKNK